jgi:hypothetical protein
MIVNNFNYPNTLAIVLANEVEQNMGSMPALKAYARDLKLWMQTCNTHDESPSKGKMRQIPLMYAASDNAQVYEQAAYLFCENKDVSIDIYGLNVERWCGKPESTQDSNGKKTYDDINQKVKEGNWNGAFLHSEEGGPTNAYYGPRTWSQLKDFASDWPYINGYFAYAYFGPNPDFNMFDGPKADANEFPDGKTFFKQLSEVNPHPPTVQPSKVTSAQCAASLKVGDKTYDLPSVSEIKIYATGWSGWAENCPKPPGPPADTAVLRETFV